MIQCADIKNKSILYLSGELSASEYTAFKQHLKHCSTCRSEFRELKKTLALLNDLPLGTVSSETRDLVIQRSKRKQSPQKLSRFRFLHLSDIIRSPRFIWGVSLAAAAVIVFVLFHPSLITHNASIDTEAVLQWHDYVFAESDWLGSEIKRIQAGVLLTNYASEIEETSNYTTTISTLSNDFIQLQTELNELEQIQF